MSQCFPDRMTNIPAVDTIHSLFFSVAAERPEVPALLPDDAGSSDVTFGQLALRARLLASTLLASGALPADRQGLVGIVCDSPVDAVLSMVAVLTTGHAFVSVERSLPDSRRQTMLAGCCAVVVATDVEGLPLPASAAVVRIPEVGVTADQEEVSIAAARPAEICCVIFTSGSTGQSKAVPLTHAQLLVRLRWQWSSRAWADGEVGCFKTSTAFVDFLAEVFGALCAGVPLATVSPAHRADSAHVASIMARRGVTRLIVVPAMLRLLLAEPALAKCASALRSLSVSGAPLTVELQQTARQVLPQCAILNLYGLSEAMADSMCDTFEVGDLVSEEAPTIVPIGFPIEGACVELRADGGYGEVISADASEQEGVIVISGPVVGLGYLADVASGNLQAVTPFPTVGGRPSVVTGDIAMRLPSGRLQFMGRLDQVLKVRGQKVSLVEVEDCVQRFPGVSQAVVSTWRPGGPVGEPRLVAHVVFGPGEGESPAQGGENDVRAAVLAELSPVHVPAVVAVDSLPLLPSGKLDRKTLRECAGEDEKRTAEARCRRVTPDSREFSATELAVARIWADVLFGDESVALGPGSDSRADGFFNLGGDSVSAAVMLGMVREVTGARVTLATFARATRLPELAAAVEQHVTAGDGKAAAAAMASDVHVELLVPSMVGAFAQPMADMFLREPLLVARGVTRAELYEFVLEFAAGVCEQGLSFVAIDGGGCIVGYSLNEDLVESPGEDGAAEDEGPPPFLAPMFALLGPLDDQAKEHHFKGAPHARGALVHLVMTSALPGREDAAAIAEACDDAALEAAASKGFAAAVSTTTSVVTEALAREQGFSELARVAFDDFEYEGQAVFRGKVPAPHTHGTLFYKDIGAKA